MGLSRDLLTLGAQLQPEEAQWGDLELPTAELCPRLRSCYSPRASWVEFKGFGAHAKASMPEWARVWDYGPPAAALGLSIAQRSKRGIREGLNGLPAFGRKQVSRSLALLEEKRALLSFWTVSLPTDALIGLAQADAWPLFQDRVRKELVRLLRRRGLPALLVGVVELQPKRSRAAGFPCPHLHLVFQGRKSRGTGWVLSPGDLDEVIRAALATAGVQAPPDCDADSWLKTAGNVQQVKKSVRAYLAKYMTKGSGDTRRWVGTKAEALLPRRWWLWTDQMRALVLEHVLPIAFGFLLWVHENRAEIEEAGLARFRILPLDDPRAPLTFEVNWLSCDRIAQLIAVWQEDQWDEDWQARYRLSQHGLTSWQP